jgi:hypothetical protein
MPQPVLQLGNALDLSACLTAAALIGLPHADEPSPPRTLRALAFVSLITRHDTVINWLRETSWCEMAMPHSPQSGAPETPIYGHALALLG